MLVDFGIAVRECEAAAKGVVSSLLFHPKLNSALKVED